MNKIQLTLVLLFFAFYAMAQRTSTKTLQNKDATSLAQMQPATSLAPTKPFFVEKFTDKLKLFTEGRQPTEKWEWKSSGEASNRINDERLKGNYWGNRSPIFSKSKGGALVFNVNKYAGSNARQMSETVLLPQTINCSKKETVYIKFNQYFREHNAVCAVLVSGDGGGDWDTFPVNMLLQNNVETATHDYRAINISKAAANKEEVRIGFMLTADNYFWIIDDVELWEVPPFEETFPKGLGVALRARGIDYRVDKEGGAYRPNEMLIKFVKGTSPTAINNLRKKLPNATFLESCRKGELQKWLVGEDLVYGNGDILSADGGSIDIIEVTKGAKTMPEIEEGSGYNYFVFNDFGLTQPATNQPFSSYPAGGSTASAMAGNTAKIAIIDTGISYGHSGFTNRFLSNSNEIRDNKDNDNNGYIDDFAGWNFVDTCNNTTDDHSHGTHVSGIVIQSLANTSANYTILPIKTQDASGLGDIFQSACGTYYAIDSKANIINASWGYYGESSDILSIALKEALDSKLLVVAAAGNEHVDLDIHQHYPSGLTFENIISVGAYDSNGLAPYSNFNSKHVDILAPGDVRSFLPSANGVDNYGNKQGTSMSAPAVVAAAAMVYSKGTTDPVAIIQKIMTCASTNQNEIGKVNGGKRLNLRASCLTGEIDKVDIMKEKLQQLQFEPKRN